LKTIYSFDVFDTLLCRPYVLPMDVFKAIEENLKYSFPSLDSRLLKSYQSARIYSEIIARRKASSEDIMIYDIYSCLGELFNISAKASHQLMLFEMQYEMKILYPINGAAEYVAECRERGEIVFISDMYLPSDFIENILACHGIARDGDKIYVSGEYGLTKGSGRLFDKVLKDFSISAQQLVHFGDNLVSDYNVPISMGIRFNDCMGIPRGHSSWIGMKIIKIKNRTIRILNVLKLFWSLHV